MGVGALAHAASARRTVVSRIPPVYPELAGRMHVSGIVVMHLVVQPDGSVSDAKPESGHAQLTPPQNRPVRRWRSEPGPETTDMTVDVSFADQP
jgi:outer membrane biosynthesis protein TonB